MATCVRLVVQRDAGERSEGGGDVAQKYEVKGRTVDEGNVEMKFSGRAIGSNVEGYDWEADEKRQTILLGEWDLADCKGVSTPMVAGEEGAKAARDGS